MYFCVYEYEYFYVFLCGFVRIVQVFWFIRCMQVCACVHLTLHNVRIVFNGLSLVQYSHWLWSAQNTVHSHDSQRHPVTHVVIVTSGDCQHYQNTVLRFGVISAVFEDVLTPCGWFFDAITKRTYAYNNTIGLSPRTELLRFLCRVASSQMLKQSVRMSRLREDVS